MTQDSLLSAIEEDAAAVSERIIEEAEVAAASIIEKAKEEAAAARAERLAEVGRELEKEANAAANRARIRLEAERLASRRKAVDRVIELATSRVSSFSGTRREELLKGLYKELLELWEAEADGAVPVVLVNPADLDIIRKVHDGEGARADESVEAGVVFTTGDGRLRFENSVSSRVRLGREELTAMISGMLFGPADGRAPGDGGPR